MFIFTASTSIRTRKIQNDENRTFVVYDNSIRYLSSIFIASVVK